MVHSLISSSLSSARNLVSPVHRISTTKTIYFLMEFAKSDVMKINTFVSIEGKANHCIFSQSIGNAIKVLR
jgi:hypothetical protein